MLHVVLYEPEIPPNTGNIIRLAANTGARLHLIHPLGFALEERRLRRAGLDYREFADIQEYASLDACLDFVERHQATNGYEREMGLWKRLRDGMAVMERVTLYCADIETDHLPLLTFNVDGMGAEDVGAILDGDFDIAARTGLHCAPLVHETLGTINRGAVRFSLGVFTTEDDISETLRAMSLIAG
jgi:selenocysteine lyase/cysteine desulfurase